MRKCYKCGTLWKGRGQPGPRQICERCGVYLHSCLNCHHFDSQISNSCKLPATEYVGPRDASNYCDEFRMVNSQLRAIEARTERARSVWDQLFES